MIIPVSAVIPTYNRVTSLANTLMSLSKQSIQFREIIIIDASEEDKTEIFCKNEKIQTLHSKLIYHKAVVKGAASQRNEGFNLSQEPFVAFMDDDIFLEPFCIERLWNCCVRDERIGGVNALITNQAYHAPGSITRIMYRLMSGARLESYAGKCIGPGWNILPGDGDDLPECVAVDWLNLGCTIYRRESLPSPPFQAHFVGYSLMEDLTLSLIVGSKWRLYNVRTARIFHDSQPGAHKNNIEDLAKMELVNRYYVMSKILKRKGIVNILKLAIFEVFGIISSVKTWTGFKKVPRVILGKLTGVLEITKIG